MLVSIGLPRRDDSDDLAFSAVSANHDEEEQQALAQTEENEPVFFLGVVGVVNQKGALVREHRLCILERHTRITLEPDGRMDNWGATGWNAPSLAPWLEQSMDRASRRHFGAPLNFIGQGGIFPLMNLLQHGFPAAQIMVCGMLGPKSNAHGSNEFLYIGYRTWLRDGFMLYCSGYDPATAWCSGNSRCGSYLATTRGRRLST